MVHSVKVCCVSKTKLCIPNQVVPLTVFLRIILKLLILTPLFYKNYTTISDISSRNVQHRLLIIPKERENLSCSMKNIPMLRENSCFLKNTEKSSQSSKEREWYELRSTKYPRRVKELVPVEKNLIALVKNIIFRKVKAFPGKAIARYKNEQNL